MASLPTRLCPACNSWPDAQDTCPQCGGPLVRVTWTPREKGTRLDVTFHDPRLAHTTDPRTSGPQ